MDLNDIPWEIFEKLCARILESEGFRIASPSVRGRDLGFDFITYPPKTNEVWIVEVKQLRSGWTAQAQINRFFSSLIEKVQAVQADRLLFITTARISTEIERKYENSSPVPIEIWGDQKLNDLLKKHASIRKDLEKYIAASKNLEFSITRKSENIGVETRDFVHRLDNMEPGSNNWKRYEDLCTDMLIHLFVPPLRSPKLQNVSDDRLDRPDAIFSLDQSNRFWDQLSTQFHTRLLVAEYKNHKSAVKQREVECLRDYLFRDALRSVGLLCSRVEPSDSALQARTRAWRESQKLIIFVSDEDFKTMLNDKDSGKNPTEILDDKINRFFLGLCP